MAAKPSKPASPTVLWEFWIDVGGTFTDCFARRPDSTLLRHKLLSSGVVKGRATSVSADQLLDSQRREPADFWRGYELRRVGSDGQVIATAEIIKFDFESNTFGLARPIATAGEKFDYEIWGGEEAPVLAIRHFLALRKDQPIPPVRVRLGTTRGTNALLTRRGAPLAFVTTKGFADVLEIGYQDRPRLFDLNIHKPRPLYQRVVEIDERISADARILKSVDESLVAQQLQEIKLAGIDAIAICLLNAYCNDEHEQRVARVARSIGFSEISLSSQVAPLIKIVARGDTTTVNAYLNPVLRSYLERLRTALDPRSDVRVLTSAGGLVLAENFQGKDSILSGPAGGVVGFSRAAQVAGFDRAIGFDMGGTSTDVSRFDERFELQFEVEKAGVRVVAPMMAIETVAAGGGSLCWFDGVKLAVGPDSAGADPGPASYGRGGPLTITDVNVCLGRIGAEDFPFPLQIDAAQRRLDELRVRIREAIGLDYTRERLAEGLLTIANANMARAIRSISVAKGYDPQDYVLAAFGGAAPQHACDVADELSMTTVLIHPDASLLSAYGIGTADVIRHKTTGLYRPYDSVIDELNLVFEGLQRTALAEVEAEGIASTAIVVRRFLDLRFQGVDASISVPEIPGETFAQTYLREHQRLYGYVFEQRPLEAVAARVEATGSTYTSPKVSTRTTDQSTPAPHARRDVQFHGVMSSCPLYLRDQLPAGGVVAGPALVTEPHSTIVIPPQWQGTRLTGGEFLIERTQERARSEPRFTRAGSIPADPIALEVFHHLFAGIAEQMGITLRNTSCSVNVKERLDFSCAVFTATGDLVANAPHIPVHLGAMSETVKSILTLNPQIHPEDVFVTNDPYQGGSHLPDVTVVTPVFDQADASERRLIFFTASRAHHAEIGGVSPGSMPPQSKRLVDEGVLIRNFKLFDMGRPHWNELQVLLSSGPYPSRAVQNNLADINAQVAANRLGERDLLALVQRFGCTTVLAYTKHIQTAAEQKMRAAIVRLGDGTRRFTDYLDQGAPIAVSITVSGDQITFDFTGTGDVLPNNLNANRAIVTSAVMYSLRCLLQEDIPLNQGVLAPVSIVLPTCLLNPPRHETPEQCAAVAGGNVETSQRVVDVILGALGAAAASQGTMNNLTFGDGTFGYYETICGGSGATPDANGASAVHTHMTNTRLTDPEVFEQRFPARVLEFSIRRGSGGAGQHRGGDGVVRRIEFLRDLEVSMLTQRRGPYAPFGLEEGGAGELGRNEVMRASGDAEALPGTVQFHVGAGDVLRILTPGGGGWGRTLSDT